MEKTYIIDPTLIWKEVDGIIYMLQPDREEIYALNETGTFIWKLLSKGYSLQKVQVQLLAEYDVTEGQAQKDIQEFIDRYVREKILRVSKKSRKK